MTEQPISFADEAEMPGDELAVGDFIVRTCVIRYRGRRGGEYVVRAMRVESGVTSIDYDERGNRVVRVMSVKDAALIVYRGQSVIARRRLS